MSTAPFFISARRRRLGKGKRLTPPPAPPVVNQITGVVHGPGADEVTATVSGPLEAIVDPPGALIVSAGINAYEAISASIALPLVTFTFEQDVSATTDWSVSEPTAWQFAEGAPLEAPLSGTID